MPLVKLNRINKGGEIVVNSDHLVYLEVESRTTTLHMVDGLLFSVEESIDTVLSRVTEATARKDPSAG